jgi:hypothetical protein
MQYSGISTKFGRRKATNVLNGTNESKEGETLMDGLYWLCYNDNDDNKLDDIVVTRAVSND